MPQRRHGVIIIGRKSQHCSKYIAAHRAVNYTAQHSTRLRTAAACDSKSAASVQMLRHRSKAALHSDKERHIHYTP
jgi:hypothetical protein